MKQISKKLRIGILGVVCVLGLREAFGNDSAASYVNGRIRLEKSSAISMQKETLTIGVSEIEVEYVFQNTSKKEITTIVAFPLPVRVYDCGDWSEATNMKVSVDGKAVSLQKEILLNGKKTAEAEALKIIAAYEECGGLEKQETYFWEQVFPPEKPIKIRHTYGPSVGSSFTEVNTLGPDLKKTACIDASTQKALEKRGQGKATNLVIVQEIDYVLKTARNWNGPISEFTLRIRKPSRDAIVSLCINGIKKVDPLTFEVQMKDYVPEQDLKIVYFNFPPS